MNQKRILGGPPIYIFIVKNNKHYPEVSQFQAETVKFYDAVYCKELPIDKISDLDMAITAPNTSLVVLLTKELMVSTEVKSILDEFKERNIKVIMYPVKAIPDSYYSIAHNMEDIHKTIYALKKTLGASQHPSIIVSSPIATSLEQIPQHQSNYGLPMPASNTQINKKVPVYFLQSSNKDFGEFANAFAKTYKNHHQIDIRQIKNMNEFSQGRFQPHEQPILIVSNAEVNKITPQLNMFRTSTPTKIHTVVYKNERADIPTSYNLVGNTHEDMNKHINHAIAASMNMQVNNQLRPNTPINGLVPPGTSQSNKMIPAQSGVGSTGGKDNYYAKGASMKSPSVGSRATSQKPTSYKPTGKIRMKSARKISPARSALTTDCNLLVCDHGQNQQFTQLYRSMPYPSQVVRDIPKDINLKGPRTLVLAPYELRQAVLGSIPREAQNIGVIFYSSTQIAPDMLIKHRFVDLTTDNPQDIAQFLKQQKFRSMSNPMLKSVSSPMLPQASIIGGMSGINSVMNSQMIRSNIQTMEWQTHPIGPGVFYTTSSENRQMIPQVNRSAYQNQLVRPPVMSKSQNISLQYPANVQTVNPYSQKPIADALELLITDIRLHRQPQMSMPPGMPNPAISQSIANAANRNLLQQLIINPRRSNIQTPQSSIIHPEVQVTQTKTVKREIIQSNLPIPIPMPNPQMQMQMQVPHPHPQIPMPMPPGSVGIPPHGAVPIVQSVVPTYHHPGSVQQSGVRSSQAYMQQSQFDKRNTAKFHNSSVGHHEWTVEKDGDYFHTNNDGFPANQQRLMSFKNKHLDSGIGQEIKYEPMSAPRMNQMRPDLAFQNKMVGNPMNPITQRSFIPPRVSNNLDLFTYQGNKPPMQWDVFRNPQNPNLFRLCPHDIYESLPQQQRYIGPNQLMLQSQNYHLSQIPTISKLSKMERNGVNPLDNIAKPANTMMNSGRNQFTMEPRQAEWSAQKKAPEYMINANQINRNPNMQINPQMPNGGMPMPMPMSGFVPNNMGANNMGVNNPRQDPAIVVTGATNHRRILTSSEEQQILYDLNSNKDIPNRIPTIQNPVFPSFGAKNQMNQLAGRQKSLSEMDDDRQIAAMIFNNNFPQGKGNFTPPLNDSGLEQINYIPPAQQINYQPILTQPIQPNQPNQVIQLNQQQLGPYGSKKGLTISQTRQSMPKVEQINYSRNQNPMQNQYFPGEKRTASPLRVNKPSNLQIRVDPTFSPRSENAYGNDFNEFSPRHRKPPQIQRQVVQVVSTPEDNRMGENYPRILLNGYRKPDGSVAETFVNNLRQSKSVGDEISNVRLSRQLAGSKSGKKGILNTVIDNNFQNIAYNGHAKYDTRNDNGVLIYSRKRNNRASEVGLSPKVQSNRFGPQFNQIEAIQYQKRNIIPTRDYGEALQTTSYNTIMNKAIDQPIQILFRRSDDFMHQVANGFQHPPFQIQKYNNAFQLQSMSRQLSLNLMTVLVTDEIPENVEKVFSSFTNFNCIIIPHDKLYKMQQARYPTFKWITETNPTTVIYKIRDYLNRYNYVNQIASQKYTKTTFSSPVSKNINIMIAQMLKDKIMLDPIIQYQVFSNDKVSSLLDQNRMNILIVEQEQVDYLQNIVRAEDKILVLQKQNQISPPTSSAELSTKNPAAILGYITRLLKESGGAISVPQVFYYFDEIDLEETIEKRLGGRITQIKYHDERSLIRKVRESGTSPMILIIGNQFMNQIEQIRRLQPHARIIQYKPLQPLPIPNSIVAKSIPQVLGELQRFR